MFAKSRLIGLGFLLLASGSVGLVQVVEDMPVGDSAAMEKASKKIKSRFAEIAASDKQPSKDDLAAVELAAQYYVFRVTWPEYNESPDKLAAALKEFNAMYKQRIVDNLFPEEKIYRDTVVTFHRALKDSFKKVLDERDFAKNRLSSVNAAMMLPVLGKSKSEDISDFLTGIISSAKQNDAVKLYAMRGLKEYFPLDPQALMVKPGDVKRVQALTNYIERKWDVKKENKQEMDACSYLRREAIRVLGQTQLAAVGFQKKRVEGQIASTLLRVLAKDFLDPPPSLSEKCTAAFALCNVKTNLQDYHPDMAIYAVGHTLGQFVTEYRSDQINFKKEPAKDKEAKDTKKGARLPWKAMSEDWDRSLAAFEAHTKNDKVTSLKKAAEPLLKAIQGYQNPNEQIANGFVNEFVTKLKTAQKIPFKESFTPDNKPLEVELGYE